MARLPFWYMRKMGAVGVALTAIDVWRRIPPEHRRRIIAETRKHGPRLVKAAVAKRRRRQR